MIVNKLLLFQNRNHIITWSLDYEGVEYGDHELKYQVLCKKSRIRIDCLSLI